MKFTLTIELGNDAMRTPHDLNGALLKVRQKLMNAGNPYAPLTQVDGGNIMDLNGNTVGEWGIS